MPVSDIMTTRLVTVPPDQTVGTLPAKFKQYQIHHLLVVEDQRLLGVISDRDVFKNLSPFVQTSAADSKDTFLQNRHARQIMSKTLITVAPSAGIRGAGQLLLDKNISLLPVVDNHKLVGVLSWKDILRYFLK